MLTPGDELQITEPVVERVVIPVVDNVAVRERAVCFLPNDPRSVAPFTIGTSDLHATVADARLSDWHPSRRRLATHESGQVESRGNVCTTALPGAIGFPSSITMPHAHHRPAAPLVGLRRACRGRRARVAPFDLEGSSLSAFVASERNHTPIIHQHGADLVGDI